MENSSAQFSEGNPQASISTNSTTNGGYATRVTANAEFQHKEKTQKQDHDHEKEMAELEHKHALEMLDKKAGTVGRYFGIEDNGSKNITLIVLIVFLIIVFFLIMMFYKETPHSAFVELVWNTAVPVLTLALGYIFGKE
ncbi:MAG: hypothetical protein NC453_20485 [Muribaculum sp.]|nr:hypothetical protein [Muribaculum sp.]